MKLLEMAREMEKEIIAIRRKIHENPELSLFEFKTAELVAKELSNLGLRIQTEVGGTGVVALLEGERPGKTLALRADMDALPIQEATGLPFASKRKKTMHACGHDMHTAILLGAAKLLSRKKDEIQGAIKFIFQPSEENSLGAKNMIEAGVLENPRVDRIVCLHTWPNLPAGKIGIRKGAMCASADRIEVEVTGKGGHAAHPDQCIDPLPIAANIITTAQTIISREISPTESAVVTFGTVTGGSASNIIASTIELTGTVRTIKPEVREMIPQSLERIIAEIAEGMRGKGTIKYRYGSPPLINHDETVEWFGEAVKEELGAASLVYLDEPSLGGEDFSYYLEEVPGMLFRLGTSDERPESELPLHNPSVVFSEKAVVPGVAALAGFALHFLEKE
ncbi:MAG: M20 family metallopeptidase [Bacillus sp. (in: firmicutes)]